MKLFLLKPAGDQKAWKPWYDKAFGFAAETEAEARSFAHEQAGDEAYRDSKWNKIDSPWLRPDESSCLEIAESTPLPAGIVLRDFAAA